MFGSGMVDLKDNPLCVHAEIAHRRIFPVTGVAVTFSPHFLSAPAEFFIFQLQLNLTDLRLFQSGVFPFDGYRERRRRISFCPQLFSLGTPNFFLRHTWKTLIGYA
jgi:hypothetical protein